MKLHRLCFSTVVFGPRYAEYIPYYIHSILETEPEQYVRILVTDPSLPDGVARSLAFLSERLSPNFEVKVGCFAQFSSASRETRAGYPLGTYLRWLLPQSEVADSEYAYVGDIDFLILPEEQPLLESHIEHSQRLGVPYSNVVREGTRKLSGLHFVRVDEYYAKTSAAIQWWTEEERLVAMDLHNEGFLYRLVEGTIGFGNMSVVPKFRPHHGFHLGCVREGVEAYVSRWIDRPEQRARLARYLGGETFGAVHAIVRNRDVEALIARVRASSPP